MRSMFTVIIMLFLVVLDQPGMSASLTIGNPVDASNVVWQSPSKDCQGSMPLGNGDIGLNVWVEENGDLLILIGKTDAWDENARLVKVGRIRVKLSPNPFKTGKPFCQTLRLSRGDIRIIAGIIGSEVALNVWVDANQPVLRIETEGRQKFSVQAHLEILRTKQHEMGAKEVWSAYGQTNTPSNENPNPVIALADTIVPAKGNRIVWYHRNTASIWEESLKLQSLDACISLLQDPLLNRTFGGIIKADGMVSQGDSMLRSSEPRKKQLMSIYLLTSNTKTPQQWINAISKVAARVDKTDIAKTRAAHDKWWKEFWNRSWIRVSQVANITQGYTLQRFITACAGRGAYPIKFNGTIFTIGANDELGFDPDYREWGGPYWLQNSRLIYWPLTASGDFDMMQPYFRMFQNAMPLAKERTRKYFGHDGAFFPETFYFWGAYTNMNYGWNREGKEPSFVLENAIKYHITGNLELLAMMLDYYDYTKDKIFLTRQLLPMAEDLLTFWDKHYKRDASGRIIMTPAQALETPNTDVVNPVTNVAGLKWVLDGLLRIPADVIGSERHKNWTRLKNDVPPLPMIIEGSTTYITEAEKHPQRNAGFENPELYPVFPFRIYGVGKPELDIGRATYYKRNTRVNRGWTQDPLQAACLGLADEAAKLVQERFATKNAESRFPAFWGPNFDWTPDQCHGGVATAALQLMLIQSTGDKIILFPAWPKDWDVDFKLHAPQKTVVEGVYKAGKLVSMKVTPESRRKDVIVMHPQ